jgi:molybdate-binding protein
MNTSILEINETEYCIKLSKDAFDLSLVRQLIKRIQSEALFFAKQDKNDEEDIIARRVNIDNTNGYDFLEDK